MFIELADHLRCPAPHDEGYLVLLPDRLHQRSVRAGTLGCPECGRILQLHEGVLDLGDGPAPAPDGIALDGEALTVLLGITGPGGFVVLVGAAGARWAEVMQALPGVAVVVVNPPGDVADAAGVSVIRGGMLPLKQASMRGVVLGGPAGADPQWVAEAARVVLPGLRVVGEGPPPGHPGLDVAGEAGGWWVGVKPTR